MTPTSIPPLSNQEIPSDESGRWHPATSRPEVPPGTIVDARSDDTPRTAICPIHALPGVGRSTHRDANCCKHPYLLKQHTNQDAPDRTQAAAKYWNAP